MAEIVNGTIKFSNEEFRDAKKFCKKCVFNTICSGPDSKTNTADFHPTISHDPTDTEIVATAACLNRN